MSLRLSSAKIAYLLAERRRGVPVKVIARALGVHPNTVVDHTSRAGVKAAHSSWIKGITQEILTPALAKRALREEIAAARAEARSAPLYKPGDLAW